MFVGKKEFNNLPEFDGERRWIGLTKKQWFIVAAILVAIVLMIVSGLVVYYGFCSTDAKSVASSDFGSNFTWNNLSKVGSAGRNCPVLPNPTCPARPTCAPSACAPPAAQPCPPPAQNCPTFSPCASHFCTTCVPTTTRPRDITLSVANMTGSNTLDIIRPHPPGSYNRLQVVIDLMKNFFEKYYQIHTRRNCEHNHRRICNMCGDRYDYLRCVVIHNVSRQKADSNHKLKPIPEGFNKAYNDKAQGSARSGTWDKGPSSLEGSDYSESLYNNMQGALALEFGPPGKDAPHCTPCSGESAVSHMTCVAEKSLDSKNNWDPLKGFV